MGLKTPEKIGKLQRTLYAKAKEQPERRFHQLYDKVWREDFLEFAYRKCKANGGAAGVDRQSFEDIEARGREKWLGELAREGAQRQQPRYEAQIEVRFAGPDKLVHLIHLGEVVQRLRRRLEGLLLVPVERAADSQE